MNVTIRTYDEIRSNRVSVEVAAGERLEITVDGSVSELAHKRLFTEDEVIAAQASEGELIGKALRADLERERKITRDLEIHYQRKLAEAAERYAQLEQSRDADLKVMDERADRLIARANELETELAEINQRAKTFRDQAYKQNDRAAELRQQIKELGDRHQRELGNIRHDRDLAEKRVEQALHELSVAAVDEALEESYTRISLRLAGAIREARSILKGEATGPTSSRA